MNDLFNEKNLGEGAPDMLMAGNTAGPNLEEYRYRIQRFELGSGEGDQTDELENLLNRSISSEQDVIIVERKDSISATTGVYTCVIVYLEKILLNERGYANA